MIDAERIAADAIVHTTVKASGPVMRPTSELVNYAHLLEQILGSRYSEFPYHELREYVAPHWVDVLAEMEV